MSHNATNKAMQTQIIAQWITSLAIAVICCAILFVVFATYIVDLHAANNLLTVRFEAMHDRVTYLQNEIAVLKRSPLVQINGLSPAQTQMQVDPQGAQPAAPPAPPAAPAAEGVQVNEPPAPAAVPTVGGTDKEDPLMPVLNPDQIGNEITKPKEPEKTKQPKK